MDQVIVLLSTYNGEKYLEEQLQSLFTQEDVQIDIIVRDDGSTDRTTEILEGYAQRGMLTWYSGSNLKPAKSFLNMIEKIPSHQWVALCDQDDIWLKDKLRIALYELKSTPPSVPALYYGKPRVVDANLKPIRLKKNIFNKSIDLHGSAINSGAAGCTMVFNKKLLSILKEGYPDFVSMHDSWIHKVCAAFNGNIIYDSDVHILYRQHGNNTMGAGSRKSLWRSRLKKIFLNDCVRSRTMESLLDCYRDKLCEENVRVIDNYALYKTSFKRRLALIFDKEYAAEDKTITACFKIAVLLGKY